MSILSHLQITVHCEPDESGGELLRHLQRTRANVRHLWPAPDRIGENCDLVVCAYGPGLSKRLAWTPGEPQAALIVLLTATEHIVTSELLAACADAVLYRPYNPQSIDVALALALDHFGSGKRQRQKIRRMEENIHAMRDIERAKQEIMARKQVGQAEAFGILRDMAMKRGITIASASAKIIDSIDVST